MRHATYWALRALLTVAPRGGQAKGQPIIPDKSIRERTLNMWKLAGMDSDARRFAKGKQILIARRTLHIPFGATLHCATPLQDKLPVRAAPRHPCLG